MTKIIKFAKWLALGLVALSFGIVVFVHTMADRTHEAPYPETVASDDPAVLARGRNMRGKWPLV